MNGRPERPLGRLRGGLMPRGAEDFFIDTTTWLVMILFSITVIYPFWKIFLDSISTPVEVYRMGFKLWPRETTLEAYGSVFSRNTIGIAYLNTILRTVAGTTLTLVVSFGAAYALSKRFLPGNKIITLLMIFTMFFFRRADRHLPVDEGAGAAQQPPGADPAAGDVRLLHHHHAQLLPRHSARPGGVGADRRRQRVPHPVLDRGAGVAAGGGHHRPVEHRVPLERLVRRPDLQCQAAPAGAAAPAARILIENQATTLFEMELESEATFAEETITAATLFVSIGPVILVYPFIQRYFVKGIMTGSLKG